MPPVRLALRSSVLAASLLLWQPSGASAVPGPASVAVIANDNVPESVTLAETYAAARQLPPGHVCALDLPEATDIPLSDFRTRLFEPFEACLADAGASDRIEAALLVRGVPLRVQIPDGDGTRLVSLAAALGVWKSETDGGEPLLGQPPGTMIDCGGTPCYAPAWSNPFRSGVFEAGWSQSAGGVTYRPLLVTMLHGRSFADAEKLLDSALAAESMAPPSGEFLFMNGADAARGVLDREYDGVITALEERGLSDASRVAFDADSTGHTLAAFFTGTSSLGETIEGNTYLPGSLVDNVTSFGAAPTNFTESGERQVSIARWVAQGVAGVHGTTAEPLNGAFPSRYLIIDWVDGSTLAESYHRRLPTFYWQNLVLGDPMAAPYAMRPELTLEGATEGETLDGARRVTVTASDPAGRGIASIALLVNGERVASTDGSMLEHCVVPPAGADVQLLAIAQAAEDPSDARPFQPKGWTALRVTGAAGATECAPAGGDGGPGADAGVRDGGSSDAGGPAPDAGMGSGSGGGGCAIAGHTGRSGGTGVGIALVVVLALGRRAGAFARPGAALL